MAPRVVPDLETHPVELPNLAPVHVFCGVGEIGWKFADKKSRSEAKFFQERSYNRILAGSSVVERENNQLVGDRFFYNSGKS